MNWLCFERGEALDLPRSKFRRLVETAVDSAVFRPYTGGLFTDSVGCIRCWRVCLGGIDAAWPRIWLFRHGSAKRWVSEAVGQRGGWLKSQAEAL